jgi:hypothetical protein
MTKKEEQKKEIITGLEKKLKNLESVNLTIEKLEKEYSELLAPLRPALEKIQAKLNKGTELKKGLEQDILTLASKEEIAGEKIQSNLFEIKFKKHSFREYNDEKAIISYLQDQKKVELLKIEPTLKKNEFVKWYEKEVAKSEEGFKVPGFELREGIKPSITEKKTTKIK